MPTRLWIVIDCCMFVAFIALQAWRLTGVPLHEWLGVALLAGILAHLLLHWSWIETRLRRVFQPGTWRTRINFTLNSLLFLSAAAAMVSGFAISKVIWPMHPAADEYLKWHSIHDTSGNIALVCVALHLALNWDRLFGGRPRFRIQPMVARLAAIAGAVVIVAAGLYAVDRAIATPDITMITRDGRRIEHAQPPRDVANLREGSLTPSAGGIPRFIVFGAFASVIAVVGRKVLRLRLD